MPPSSAEGLPNVGRLLIVGLGNHTHPGTRHNVGMMAVDYSVGQLLPNPGAWRTSKAIGGWIAETVLDGTSVPGMSEGWARHVLFLKPKTYMNFSGGPVLKALRELDVSPSDIIVLHDDLERKLSGVSVKSSGSANGHNGLRSMIASLKADNFQRVRIGIDRPASKDPSAVGDYVLQRFTEPEMDKLKDVALPAAHATLMNLIRTSKGISG
ncbi:peptidyl-tRNA hydrolase protein 1 [Thoreauomyces humboldtii]|nr:peptidyl-tRNA hydrolase protein 1 [Thoreauomyces humboldtii]